MASASPPPNRVAFPQEISEFKDDARIHFSKTEDRYHLEDEDGSEWEFNERAKKWLPVLDEALLERQREAYKIEGVDDDVPVIDPKKRKADDATDAAANKKAKPAKQPAEPVNRAVYVTSLPADTTIDEIYERFSKFGIIAQELDSSKPRIKMYANDDNSFKGDALVVYFRPESVQIAILMLDETDFRLGEPTITGPMRVTEADANYKRHKEVQPGGDAAKKKGTQANRDRQKAIKKNQAMNNKLADWDDDDPSAIPETDSRWDKVVVVKHVFTLEELANDPNALNEIQDDMKEEAETLGDVTKVTLFDKEEAGVVTIRFADDVAARACVEVFNGRSYDKQTLVAYIADGTEKFKKSRIVVTNDDDDEEERLENFSKFIEGEAGEE